MDREQIMGGVQDELECVGSDVGGTIPPLQGANLPTDAGVYMSEEFQKNCACLERNRPTNAVCSLQGRSKRVGKRC